MRIFLFLSVSVMVVLFYQNCGKSFETALPSKLLQDDLNDANSVNPPSIVLNSVPAAITNKTDVNISYSVTTAAGVGILSVKCKLDDSAEVDCLQGFSKSGLAQGNHRLSIIAVSSNNIPSREINVDWIVDSNAPIVSFIQSPSDIVSTANISVLFSAIDNGSGVKNVSCMLDNKTANCTFDSSTGQGKFDISDLTAGGKTLSIKVTDMAENVFNLNKSFNVDFTLPSVKITSGPPSLTNQKNVTFTYSGASTTGASLTAFECSTNEGKTYSACNGGSLAYINLFIADSKYTFMVRSIDNAGKKSAPASHSWLLDTKPPIAPTVVAAVATNQASINVSFSSLDTVYTSVNSGVDPQTGFVCSLNDQAIAKCISPLPLTLLQNKQNVFKIKSKDRAGNFSTEVVKTITHDSAGPVITLTQFPATTTSERTATFAFSMNEQTSSRTCILDNVVQGSCNSPMNFSNLSFASHTFKITATDLAGNIGQRSFTWQVKEDVTPPQPPPLPPFPIGNSYPYSSIDASFIDNQGNIYILTTGVATQGGVEAPTYNLRKYDSSGKLLLRFGRLGSNNGEFNKPKGIVVDLNGNIYIADTENNRIQKFNSLGKYVSSIGSAGNGDGQFMAPKGLALDTQNNLYVADSGNGRIQKFNSSGSFVMKFGSKYQSSFIIANGEFKSATSVALDSLGNIFVADNSERVQKFSPKGNFLLKIERTGSSSDQFYRTSSIAIDPQDKVYINGDRSILTFKTDGSFLAEHAPKYFTNAYDFNIDSKRNIYFIRNYADNDVMMTKYDPSVSNILLRLDLTDSYSQIKIDSQGNIFVASNVGSDGFGGANIRKYDKSGQLVKKFGSFGANDGQFINFSIALDSQRNILVSDFGRSDVGNVHRIQKFDNSGNFIAKYDIPEDPNTVAVSSIELDSSDNIHLLSYSYATRSYSVLKFSSNGQLLNKIPLPVISGSGYYALRINTLGEFIVSGWGGAIHKFNNLGKSISTMTLPGGISVGSFTLDSGNNMYVTTTSKYRVYKYDSSGNLVLEFGNRGDEAGSFSTMYLSIALDNTGNIYIAERRKRIQKFNPNGTPLFQ